LKILAAKCLPVQVLKENQLEMEKLKAETDKKKIQALQDQLRDKVCLFNCSLLIN
jgi:hypothetical protein